MKKKIAVVVQRYGLKVNGGSELHCRQLVERLQKFFDMTVLTTCALDYYSWKNHYPSGLHCIHGIHVQRFPVDFERNKKSFDALSVQVFSYPSDVTNGEKWMKAQGPYSSKLFSYISQHEADYDFFIFFTYLYATTYFGISLVKDTKKIILIPTAHDEPPIYLKIFDSVFRSPNKIIYNTETERNFIHQRFHNTHITNILAGVGVEFPQNYTPHPGDFVKKYGLNYYIIYVGRIDESKGCKEMFEYFFEYKKSTHSPIQLVLLGKAEMDIPRHKDLIVLGFVSDQDKFDAIVGAQCMVVPSPYESLSMSLLESFLCKKAVLVNGRCAVLKNHCIQSNGGLWYSNVAEFIEGLDYLLSHNDEMKIMENNGYSYVQKNYQWDLIIEKIRQVFCQ